VFDTIILLAGEVEAQPVSGLLRQHNPQVSILTPQSRAELEAIAPETLGRARLIGFLTPIVVAKPVLDALGYGAYNFHPGPPEYPGWLPSLFAVYDRATAFGATAHHMAAQVDAGPIIGIERFALPAGATVEYVEKQAFIESVRLMWRFGPALAKDPAPLPALPVAWSGRRSTRAMLRGFCDIAADIGQDEIDRRIAAFGHAPLGDAPTITVHGHTFRYVPPASEPEAAAVPAPPPPQKAVA
jgi:methionyl-tRNA formyltransferase